MGVDPDTVVERRPPPSKFGEDVRKTQKCFTAALRMLVASDAKPDLKARAEKHLKELER